MREMRKGSFKCMDPLVPVKNEIVGHSVMSDSL